MQRQINSGLLLLLSNTSALKLTSKTSQSTTYAHYQYQAASSMIPNSSCLGTNDDGLMMGWTDVPVSDCCNAGQLTYGNVADACADPKASGSTEEPAPQPSTEEPASTQPTTYAYYRFVGASNMIAESYCVGTNDSSMMMGF